MDKAVCVYEPRGDYGLEGFQLGDFYSFQECSDKNGKKYYRVFPTENYYEICGPMIFKKYFKEI